MRMRWLWAVVIALGLAACDSGDKPPTPQMDEPPAQTAPAPGGQ